MSDKQDHKLRVVLCWHMHQPHYRDPGGGEYHLPWTYLHGTKDYVDMAAHLERVPEARAVVNFAPVLLDQLTDYARQIRAGIHEGAPIGDRLLAALANPVMPGDCADRLRLVRDCLRINEERIIKRFPAFERLAKFARWLDAHPDVMDYVDDQLIADILTWYHLGWIAETVRRDDGRIHALQEKEAGFTWYDRRLLLEVMAELLEGVTERYRRLAERGQIELSVTPFAHPMIPLLLDFASAREAIPDLPLPESDGYPGGRERARWHIDQGLATFERHFGHRPRGCWPAEGGISSATMTLLEEAGFEWTASGEGVLGHSLASEYGRYEGPKERNLCHPYRLEKGRLPCFFRDDELSDVIGFQYSDWHADDAVANLIHRLEEIREKCADDPAPVVPIVLDGENAWEYYPENGYHFLSALYTRLAEHPKMELTTFSECVDAGVKVNTLPRLVAGSWVYGTLTTWIGEPSKNRGWDMLVDAKEAYDKALDELDEEQRAAATHQLAVCEGSDWFWWFGDYNPADTVADFERLYRRHLSHLYQLIRREPPQYLSHVFTHGRGRPEAGGVMRPGQAHS